MIMIFIRRSNITMKKNKKLTPPKWIVLAWDCAKNFEHKMLQESEARKKIEGSNLVRVYNNMIKCLRINKKDALAH